MNQNQEDQSPAETNSDAEAKRVPTPVQESFSSGS